MVHSRYGSFPLWFILQLLAILLPELGKHRADAAALDKDLVTKRGGDLNCKAVSRLVINQLKFISAQILMWEGTHDSVHCCSIERVHL